MPKNELKGTAPVSKEELIRIAKNTFDTDTPSTAELKYVMTLMTPSLYLLSHHSVHGHPLTFSIPNRDITQAQSHRPWQVDIINDQFPDKAVRKSRQLGLSEMHVAESIWLLDRYSEDKIKALYTFPKLCGAL